MMNCVEFCGAFGTLDGRSSLLLCLLECKCLWSSATTLKCFLEGSPSSRNTLLQEEETSCDGTCSSLIVSSERSFLSFFLLPPGLRRWAFFFIKTSGFSILSLRTKNKQMQFKQKPLKTNATVSLCRKYYVHSAWMFLGKWHPRLISTKYKANRNGFCNPIFTYLLFPLRSQSNHFGCKTQPKPFVMCHWNTLWSVLELQFHRYYRVL